MLHADRERVISPEQLPAAAKAFLKQHFPDHAVSYAQSERDDRKTTYEVYLNNGTEISFSAQGEWDKVDCQRQPVPAALIPTAIADYVQAHFPGTHIIEIDKGRHSYDIELSNDLELKFNKNGKFLRIDD